jgi:carboxyl-terminal processing protease
MKKYFLLSLLALLVAGCEKEKNTNIEANTCLYNFMSENYFWKDKMPEVDPASYSDPQELFNVLKYSADKWSFIKSSSYWIPEKRDSYVTGFGLTLGLDQDKEVRVVTILKESDLYSKGVRRGWTLKTIEGTLVKPFIISNDSVGLNNLYGGTSDGVSKSFEFLNPSGVLVNISATQSCISYPTALMACDTMHLSSGITGYINYSTLLLRYKEEVYPALDYMKSCQVQNLILDLRYNSEGFEDFACFFASTIAGNDYHSKPWLKLHFNNSPSEVINFILTNYSLNVKRVVFITSGKTAAGSEMLIAGLRPYLDVKVIGSRTAGNPYIFSSTVISLKKQTNIDCFIVNAEARGTDNLSVSEGITPDYEVSDDITHDFGDHREECLAAAIDYLETVR